MPTFHKYKKIRSVLSEFPGVKTYKEFDILIEIGYHQEQDNPLTLKQLLLLGVASQATVRRYLATLVSEGMVEKVVAVNDHRSVILKLNPSTIRMLTNHLSRVVEHLSAIHTEGNVSTKPRNRKKKT